MQKVLTLATRRQDAYRFAFHDAPHDAHRENIHFARVMTEESSGNLNRKPGSFSFSRWIYIYVYIYITVQENKGVCAGYIYSDIYTCVRARSQGDPSVTEMRQVETV